MIQKTCHITDFTPGKLERALDEVRTSEPYESASQVLLFMMEQNWDEDNIRLKMAMIRERLPGVEIAGVTHYDGIVQGMDAPDADIQPIIGNNSILSFLFFRLNAKSWGLADF